jgi:sortase (surface protein transpeptidase)
VISFFKAIGTFRGPAHIAIAWLSIKVVNTSAVTVVESDGNGDPTLVTCFPFYFVGAPPKRFIVRAERVT